MPTIKLPINVPYRNYDDSTIGNNAYVMKDCYFDDAMNIVKRPCVTKFAEIDSDSIDGIFWSNYLQLLFIVANGTLYKITDINGTVVTIGTGLNVGQRVSFAEIYDVTNSAYRIFMANGGYIYYTNGTTITKVTGSNAPSRCSHLGSMDTYLVCNDLDYPFVWRASEVENPTVINQSYSAQGNTDNISGLFVNRKRVYVFGDKSIEPFYNSGDTVPFRVIQGAFIERGIVGISGFGIMDGIIFFVTSNRDIYAMSAYTPEYISASYAKEINGYSAVNDVEVDVITSIAGKRLIMFNFNDAAKTLVYDVVRQCFYEWGTWDGATHKSLSWNKVVYASAWNKTFCCSRVNGKIFTLSNDKYNDDGVSVRTELTTGWYNHNTFENKACSGILFDTRRGDGLTSSGLAGGFVVQIRDDHRQIWSNQIQYNLGVYGDSRVANKSSNYGTYQTRQYRIVHQDDCPFVLRGIYETIS